MPVAPLEHEGLMPSRLIVLVVVVAGYLVPSVPAHASGPVLITGGITTHVVMPGIR